MPRQRPQLHRRLDDHAECAVRADEELGQIVARDVLHDLAAALHDGAVRGHDRHADQEIAGRAVEMAPRPASVRREHPADGRAVGVGGIERQPLAAAPERRLERRDRHSGLDRRREIAGLVIQEPAEPAQPHDEPGARRGHADACGGAASPRRHRAPDLGGQRHHDGDLLDRSGKHRGLRRTAFDDVRRELDASQEIRGAHGRAELVEQRVRHGGCASPR